MNDIVLECQHVAKIYQDGAVATPVLADVSLALHRGERVAIIGPSGSGKSTLLHILGGLDFCTHGDVKLAGQSLAQLRETQRCQLRNEHLGFVYQFHHLLPEFTALENVAMPLLIAGTDVATAMQKAEVCLSAVGLSERLQHKVSQLSGGEKQRTAIARAMVTGPTCLLADEPTGNLDTANAHKVFALFHELEALANTAMLIVTHDQQLAHTMDRVYELNNGALHEVTRS